MSHPPSLSRSQSTAIEPDELYTLRNLFWLGNYQLAINEANTLNKLPSHLVIEKQEYVYRSYIALEQYHIVMNEIKENAKTSIGIVYKEFYIPSRSVVC
jgi:hypothetical protein